MYNRTMQQIDQYLKEGVFVGVSYAFIRGNQEVAVTKGLAQIIPEEIPLTEDLLFDVASLTKVICTTTVVLQLLEEGLVQLDDPVKRHYPKYQDPHVTIRHLLTHTADITTYIEKRDQLAQSDLIEAYHQVMSGRLRGKQSKYTDVGMILLGLMLEEILQKPVIKIFEERVLKPLQMNDSCFLPTDPALTVPTENHPVRGLIRGSVHDPKAFILAEHAGNAGLFAHLTDIQKFVKMYLHRGWYQGRQILQEKTILGLLKDHSFAANHPRSLGWDLKRTSDGTVYLFHTGYTGTFLLMDLLAEEAFIFLSNRVHPVDKRQAYIEKRDELIQVYLEEKAAHEAMKNEF